MGNDMQLGRNYATQHGEELAKEILSWRKTGTYHGSALRGLAYIIQPIDRGDAMRLAEDLVVQVALESLANHTALPSDAGQVGCEAG